MPPSTAAAVQHSLLHAWESLHGASPTQRALGLLQAVWPQADPDDWHRASVGERDGCLFVLQSSLFGPRLQTQVACPACGERLESQFEVGDICLLPTRMPAFAASFEFEHDGYRIRYRLPTSEDLLALPRPSSRQASADPDSAVAALLQRCVLQAERADQAVSCEQLPAPIVQGLSERMAEHDPVADLRLDMICPACDEHWSCALDIGAYVWSELDDWAQDLLLQVDALARHYAWSERDILALTPLRRRFYLDLVQA
ncbi:MAG: hypothetical protein ACREP7_09895 [Lysobacter sp.]